MIVHTERSSGLVINYRQNEPYKIVRPKTICVMQYALVNRLREARQIKRPLDLLE